MSKKWIINGVPAETIWRNGKINGSYTVTFNKDDATLADIEGIDWAHPEVKRGPGNDEQFHCLPEGYGFKLNSVNYTGSMQRYTAEISVLAQYLGDVTGYQAQIEEKDTAISGLQTDLEAVRAAASGLENDLEQAYELLYGGEDA